MRDPVIQYLPNHELHTAFSNTIAVNRISYPYFTGYANMSMDYINSE